MLKSFQSFKRFFGLQSPCSDPALLIELILAMPAAAIDLAGSAKLNRSRNDRDCSESDQTVKIGGFIVAIASQYAMMLSKHIST